MNTKFNKLYIAAFALMTVAGNAQSRKIAKADEQFKSYSYIDARDTYIKVLERGYESQDLIEKVADSYYYNNELIEAEKWYTKLYTKYSETLDPEYLFRYAQTLKSVKQYDEADNIMQKFQELKGDEKRVQLFKAERNYLNVIEENSNKFEVSNLEAINTKGSDFGPSFYGSRKMVFASSRDNTPMTKIVHEWNESEYLNLYETKRLKGAQEGQVAGLDPFSSKVNSKFHESTPVFTKDARTVYFTRNNYTDGHIGANTDGTTLLKLYKANFVRGKWTNIVELPFNSDQYSTAHPALSPDETKLYFSSDMEGTRGMSDLYVVDILGSNTYSDPVNLGDVINTEGRETFPFITESGKLYFASEGHPGLGGLDVFVAVPNEDAEGGFDAPINVGKPVNSPEDDFSLILEESSRFGFFTSNRQGGIGSDDIYSLELLEPLFKPCEQTVAGKVYDKETGKLLPGVVVALLDNDLNKIASAVTDADGAYDIKTPFACENVYIVQAQKQGYEPKEKGFEAGDVAEFKNTVDLNLAPGKETIPTQYELKVGDDLAKVLQINNIYFDLDKYYIRKDAQIELEKILIVLEQYPNMHIDVRSHTDSRASFMYNYKLSSNRAKSTAKYLVDKGIAKERLTGRGYGEIQPVNECADGVRCSEAKHQENRRSEFIITKM